MVWREYIAGLATTREGQPRLLPAGPPVNPGVLAAIEAALMMQLPADLRGLYAEMDGVDDPSVFWRVIMPTEEIVPENARLRELVSIGHPQLYATNFNDYLFFAGRGNGDMFGFPIREGVIQQSQVVDWDHEMDVVSPIADSLRDFLRWWVGQSSSER